MIRHALAFVLALALPTPGSAGLMHYGAFGQAGAGGSFYHNVTEYGGTWIVAPNGLIKAGTPFDENLNSLFATGHCWAQGCGEFYQNYIRNDPGRATLWMWNCQQIAQAGQPGCPVDGGSGTALSGSTTHLDVSGIVWTDNEFNARVVVIRPGGPNEETRTVDDTLANGGGGNSRLTWVTPLSVAVSNGDDFTVFQQTNGVVLNRRMIDFPEYVYDGRDAGGHTPKRMSWKRKTIEQGGPVATALMVGRGQGGASTSINAAAPSGGTQVFTRATGSFETDGFQVGWRALVWTNSLCCHPNDRAFSLITAVSGNTITIENQPGSSPIADTGGGTELIMAGANATWRHSIELWNKDAAAWDEIYAYEFDWFKYDCGHPSNPCAGGGWIATIEVNVNTGGGCPQCDPGGGCPPGQDCQMPRIPEVGFEGLYFVHDGGTSYLDSPGTTFRVNDEADELDDSWGMEHRLGNHTYTVGNDYEGVLPALMGCQ